MPVIPIRLNSTPTCEIRANLIANLRAEPLADRLADHRERANLQRCCTSQAGKSKTLILKANATV